MRKGSFKEENVSFVNIYVTNIGAAKYIKQIISNIKGEFNSNTIILGDFSIVLISMDKSSR